jgi:hypothetical protein
MTRRAKEILSGRELIGFKRVTGGQQVLCRASSAKVTVVEPSPRKELAEMDFVAKPRKRGLAD